MRPTLVMLKGSADLFGTENVLQEEPKPWPWPRIHEFGQTMSDLLADGVHSLVWGMQAQERYKVGFSFSQETPHPRVKSYASPSASVKKPQTPTPRVINRDSAVSVPTPQPGVKSSSQKHHPPKPGFGSSQAQRLQALEKQGVVFLHRQALEIEARLRTSFPRVDPGVVIASPEGVPLSYVCWLFWGALCFPRTRRNIAGVLVPAKLGVLFGWFA